MSTRTINIELRIDFSDDDKHQFIITVAKQVAKQLYTSALLISEKRKPQITIHSSDFILGTEEIDVAEDDDSPTELHPPEGSPNRKKYEHT